MKRASKHRERGVAMFIAMFALLLLSAVAFGLMFMADSETKINANYRATQVAYFAARAGLEEVRARLVPGQANSIAAPTGLPSTTAANVRYVLNPDNNDSVQPWSTSNAYFDEELCNENFSGLSLTATGAGVPCVSAPSGSAWYTTSNSIAPGTGTAAALPYKWVRLTMKANNTASPGGTTLYSVNPSGSNTVPVCWDGTNQILLPTGYATCESDPPTPGGAYYKSVYVITAMAETEPTFGAQQGSRRMAQMEVAFDPPFITNSAVASQASVTLQGSHEINGYDSCSCSCTGSGASMTCTNKPGKICDNSHYAVFTEGTITTNGSSGSVSAGTTPVSQQNATWPYDIPSIINKYKSQAGTVQPYTDTQCPLSGGQRNCGTQSNQVFGTYPTGLPDNPTGSVPQVTYIQGSVRLTSAATGSGILIVDGDLEISGGLNWYGLILVKGVVQFTGGAGQQTNIYGAVLAGETVDSTNAVLGGSVDLTYDLCALKQMNSGAPPTKLASHEKMF